ncbi:hypothetical protein [Streptomyces sp. NPDC088727]|uniref:hypothetical protein n=1 Tax=Streptomyces sp. NPDC088727 TaxID=3365875 RepID=UPI003810884A
MRSDFDSLVTIAIADATQRDIPSSTRRLLRKRDWHLFWRDALKYTVGELQISTEIMAAENDPRTKANLQRLALVRKALTGADKVAAEFRRRAHRAELSENGFYISDRVARSILMRLHPETRPKAPHTSDKAADRFDTITDGCTQGWLAIPRTSDVESLLEASPLVVRNVTARDAQTQQDRNAALRHPLMLGRWHRSLQELAEITCPRAGASSPHALGPLPPDANRLPHEERSNLFRARRFMAAVMQRQAECDYQARWALQAVTQRRKEDPSIIAYREAYDAAGHELAAKYPDEYAYVLERLAPYEYRPGHLDTKVSVDTLTFVRRQIYQTLSSRA